MNLKQALVLPCLFGQHCARCINVTAVSRNVSYQSRNKTAKLATLLYNRDGSENNMVPSSFLRSEIMSSDRKNDEGLMNKFLTLTIKT
jgi:hypothetical protein